VTGFAGKPMLGPHDVIAPGALLIGLAMAGLALWRVIVWIKDTPLVPDPWDAEIEQGVQHPEAVCVCHRCFTPVPSFGWFCEHCGCAVGPYNNLMPYVKVFSLGEVFRNGVGDKMRASPLTIGGYLLSSMSNYLVFAPVYWYFLFRNLTRIRREEAQQPPLEVPGA
jgi:hypothetical protein